MTVVFDIPEEFSDNLSFYYMDADGSLEKQECTVDKASRTLTAELVHFSTYVIADEDTKVHVHGYTAIVTDPTCTSKGYTTYTCSCGDSYVDDTVEMLDHVFGEWECTVAPTSESEVTEVRKCNGCDKTEERSVDKLSITTPSTKNPDTNKNEGSDKESSIFVWVGVAITVLVVVAAAIIVIIKKKK